MRRGGHKTGRNRVLCHRRIALSWNSRAIRERESAHEKKRLPLEIVRRASHFCILCEQTVVVRRGSARKRRFYLQYNHKMQIIAAGRYRTLVLRYLKHVLAARVSNKMQIREKRDVTKEKIRNRTCEPGKRAWRPERRRRAFEGK